MASRISPGVGAVSQAIAENPADLPKYTWTNNLVGVISDGSAILGLGDLGPKAAMPVMEGKALLFKHFASVDAVPIVLDVHEPEEIITTVGRGSWRAISGARGIALGPPAYLFPWV